VVKIMGEAGWMEVQKTEDNGQACSWEIDTGAKWARRPGARRREASVLQGDFLFSIFLLLLTFLKMGG